MRNNPNMKRNMEETREQRFRRVATRRTNEILNRLRILGNCSNKSAYSYSEEDVQKIFTAIDRDLRSVKAKFGNTRRTEFRL